MAIKDLKVSKNAKRILLAGTGALMISGCSGIVKNNTNSDVNNIVVEKNSEILEEDVKVYDNESIKNCRIVKVCNNKEDSYKYYVVDIKFKDRNFYNIWVITNAITGDELFYFNDRDEVYSYYNDWANFNSNFEIFDYGCPLNYISKEFINDNNEYTRSDIQKIFVNFVNNVSEDVKESISSKNLKKRRSLPPKSSLYILDHIC